MSIDIGYCEAWPDEMKALSRTIYREEQRVRNLEAYIARVDPDEFDEVMAELENAKATLRNAVGTFTSCNYHWALERDMRRHTAQA